MRGHMAGRSSAGVCTEAEGKETGRLGWGREGGKAVEGKQLVMEGQWRTVQLPWWGEREGQKGRQGRHARKGSRHGREGGEGWGFAGSAG